MAELEWQGIPEQASLRRALRHALRRAEPTLRVIAEDFLAESTPIDLLAIGAGGDLLSLRIGGESEETSLFTRALADLAWLRPRRRDLLKLAPGLGLEATAEPRAMIFCPHFTSESRLAAESLAVRSLELLDYRCLKRQGQLMLLLERRAPAVDRPEFQAPEPDDLGLRLGESNDQADPTASPSHNRLSGPPGPSTFRTGLTDADLRLESTGERANR